MKEIHVAPAAYDRQRGGEEHSRRDGLYAAGRAHRRAADEHQQQRQRDRRAAQRLLRHSRKAGRARRDRLKQRRHELAAG